MKWATWLAKGEHVWKAEGSIDWDKEVDRFFLLLGEVDSLVSAKDFNGSVEKMIQGPFADALTHVGQIMMLRRLASAPVRGENFAIAEIVAGRVTIEQAAPKFEFD